MKQDKINKAIIHCYRMLYANATPPAAFDELVKNATINAQGQKEIPYMNHQIDQSKFDEIVHDTIKIHKISPVRIQQKFKSTILLGCSPTFTKINNEEGC